MTFLLLLIERHLDAQLEKKVFIDFKTVFALQFLEIP